VDSICAFVGAPGTHAKRLAPRSAPSMRAVGLSHLPVRHSDAPSLATVAVLSSIVVQRM
jgi:hypothetical protein